MDHLNKHIAAVHTESEKSSECKILKIFECSVCPYNFCYKEHLDTRNLVVIICARYVAGGPRLRDDGVITGPRRCLFIVQYWLYSLAVVS